MALPTIRKHFEPGSRDSIQTQGRSADAWTEGNQIHKSKKEGDRPRLIELEKTNLEVVIPEERKLASDKTEETMQRLKKSQAQQELGKDQRKQTECCSAKPKKPAYSYVALIALAIDTAPERKLTLRAIYEYISREFPYYKMADKNWQNSIRHNLSLQKCFRKVPKEEGPSASKKGNLWTLTVSFGEMFEDGNYKRKKRARTVYRTQFLNSFQADINRTMTQHRAISGSASGHKEAGAVFNSLTYPWPSAYCTCPYQDCQNSFCRAQDRGPFIDLSWQSEDGQQTRSSRSQSLGEIPACEPYEQASSAFLLRPAYTAHKGYRTPCASQPPQYPYTYSFSPF